MTTQEKILQDKWLECVYHLDRMNEKWLKIQSEKAEKNIVSREFKYEFNSFVNSCRSVTFVMQKCFKNKAVGFEDWYQGVQDELKKNNFAKILVDLRNTNQKEGNKYPDIIQVKAINKYFQSETTFSPFPIQESNFLNGLEFSEEEKKLLPNNISNFNLVPIIENFGINLVYDNKPDETYEEVRDKMEKILLQKISKEISIKMSEITEEELRNAQIALNKLKIEQKIFTWEEFYGECKKILLFHKEKCLECIKLFV
jgi:hypothetical protein